MNLLGALLFIGLVNTGTMQASELLPTTGTFQDDVCSDGTITVNDLTSTGTYEEQICDTGLPAFGTINVIGTDFLGTPILDVDLNSFTTTVNGQELGAGTHTQVLTNAAGCDSLLTVVITNPVVSTQNSFPCEDSVAIDGINFSEGRHYIVYNSSKGCDSISFFNVVLRERTIVDFGDASYGPICPGDGPITIALPSVSLYNPCDFDFECTGTDCDGTTAGEDSVVVMPGDDDDDDELEYKNNLSNWSGIGVTDNGIDFLGIPLGATFDPTGLAPGVYTITYTDVLSIPAGTGGCTDGLHAYACEGSASIEIVIGESSETSIEESVCANETVSIGGTEYGVGTYTLNLSNAVGCDSTVNITVTESAPVVEAGMYDALCEAEGLLALSGSPAGGTWSGTGVTGNNFDPTGLLGTNTLTYTYTDDNGCTNSATVDIEVEEGFIQECTGDYIPGFIFMGEHNGNLYYCSAYSSYTWYQANDLSQAAGGHLVTIGDDAENEFVRSHIMNKNVWIGYNDEAVEGDFVWSSGEVTGYENWQAGEPNNSNGYEHFARMRRHSGEWTDRPYWKHYEFVMEIPCATDLTCEPEVICEDASNDEIWEATTLTVDGECEEVCTDNTSVSTWPYNYSCCGSDPYNDVWYHAAIPASGSLTLETSAGTLDDVVIGAYYYYCGYLYYLGCSDDGNAMADMTITGPTGYDIYFRIWGDNYNTGTFSVCAIDGQVSSKNDSNALDLEQALEAQQIETLQDLSLKVAPNPIVDYTTVSYQIPMEDEISIQVYDVTGKMVYQTAPEFKEAGFQTQTLTLDQLTTGKYLLHIRGSNWEATQSILVVK